MKSGSPPKSYTPDGLLLEDGTEVKADVIVFTTGFVQNMRSIAGQIVGPEIESQLLDFWGMDEEGELKGAFKYTGRKQPNNPLYWLILAEGKKKEANISFFFLIDPGVWYTGGDIGFARYYSRYIALQIKAQLMGSPLKVYKA